MTTLQVLFQSNLREGDGTLDDEEALSMYCADSISTHWLKGYPKRCETFGIYFEAAQDFMDFTSGMSTLTMI